MREMQVLSVLSAAYPRAVGVVEIAVDSFDDLEAIIEFRMTLRRLVRRKLVRHAKSYGDYPLFAIRYDGDDALHRSIGMPL